MPWNNAKKFESRRWKGRVHYKYCHMVFGKLESTGIFPGCFLNLNLQHCVLKVTYITLHTVHQITHYLTNQWSTSTKWKEPIALIPLRLTLFFSESRPSFISICSNLYKKILLDLHMLFDSKMNFSGMWIPCDGFYKNCP